MRSVYHFQIFIFISILAIGITACNSKTETYDDHAGHDHGDAAATAEDKTVGHQFEVNAEFQKQLAEVFSRYVSMKEAFVSSNDTKVREESTKVSDALKKVDMNLVDGAAHNDWMTFLTPMQTSLMAIQTTKDIEVQRKEFSVMSDNLYKTIKAFGLGGQEAFYEFCPMAFNNEGGYWLSDKEEIRNPYFGDAMLTCGSVQERLN